MINFYAEHFWDASNFLLGYAHPRAIMGIARKITGVRLGRLKTSRTSGGIAAKNRFEKLDPGG